MPPLFNARAFLVGALLGLLKMESPRTTAVTLPSDADVG